MCTTASPEVTTGASVRPMTTPAPLWQQQLGGTPRSGTIAGGAVIIEHRTLVAFLSGSCLTCQRFWDAFQKPQKLGLPRDVRPVIVTKGPDQESPAAIARERSIAVR